MPDRLKPRPIPERQRIAGIELLRLFVLALVCLAVAANFAYMRHVDRNVHTNRETGYQSRAVTCDLIQSLGKPLPAACLDPNVRRYMK